MSLTSELRDAGSPVRMVLDGISPRLAGTLGNSKHARAMSAALGMVELANSEPIVPLPPGVDAARSGTAFDIRTRIALGGFDVRTSTSATGIAELPDHVDKIENGLHRARILTEAFQIAEELLSGASGEADLDRASILLAHCEQIHRAGNDALSGSLGDACDAAVSGLDFAEALDPLALGDIRSLLVANAPQINAWRDQITAGERFEPNPEFSGAMLLGGADGDWLVGETLIDCKVYAELSIPTLRGFLRQLLGYVMLDLEDALSVRSVGVWLPRQGLMPTWTLEQLFDGDPDELLPTLRERFVKATERDQIAVHVPVSERRKLQLLADNRNTPQAMLVALALGDDTELRFRVGRNDSASENLIRTLAADRYARVREGVAKNPATPANVVDALRQDKSIVVRRAAAANPGRLHSTPSVSIARATTDASTTESITNSQGLASTGSMDLAESQGAVQIRQERGQSEADIGLWGQMVNLLRNSSPELTHLLPIPNASRNWASIARRVLAVPEQLKVGLPDQVKSDLMREERPAHIRRLIADSLAVSDAAVREKLLGDSDAEIRWSALRRSIHESDNSTADFLAELAASRTARIEFRTGGLPSDERWRTPSEYSEEVLEVVAMHPSTPLTSLKSFAQVKSLPVLTALAGNTSLDAETTHLLIQRIQSMRSADARKWFAASHRVPAVVLERLAKDPMNEVRFLVAENATAPVGALQLLANDRDQDVRLSVLANRGAPSELTNPLAASLLATCADLWLHEVLDTVTRRGGYGVPSAMIEDALDRLSKSRMRDPDMRIEAAGNEYVGAKTLARLAKSADVEVRATVAGNPRTAPDVLNGLLLDGDSNVRIAARKNLAAKTAEPDDGQSGGGLELVHKGSRRTAAELQEMAANRRAKVRMAVAYSPDSTPDILTFLGGERQSVQVRRVVAANPNTPPAVLRSLANENDAETRQAVAFNVATPIDVLVDLAGQSVGMALLVTLNPDVPLAILDALAEEDGELLIKYVAEGVRVERVAALEDEPEAGSIMVHAEFNEAPSMLVLDEEQ